MNDTIAVDARLLRQHPLPPLQQDADKNSRGTALVVGGSAAFPGAVLLSGTAAFRAGAGKVLLAVPRELALPMAMNFPEAGVHGLEDVADSAADLLPRVDAVLLGPGFDNEALAGRAAVRLLGNASGKSLVIDAFGLAGLWEQSNLTSGLAERLILTPHAGEMARLTGMAQEAVCADPLRCAGDAAAHLGCVIVLKGATTVIAHPDGRRYVHSAAVPALATSGSGDVLAGILVGLLSRGAEPIAAAAWAVHLHAEAGHRLTRRLGPLGLLARELPDEIPRLMRVRKSYSV